MRTRVNVAGPWQQTNRQLGPENEKLSWAKLKPTPRRAAPLGARPRPDAPAGLRPMGEEMKMTEEIEK